MDAAVVFLAVALGALFLSPELHDNPDPWSARQIVVDVGAGAVAYVALWCRRRWPVGVALLCMLAGVVSTSATPAGLLALSSLAVHRPARPTILVALLWVPCLLAYSVYTGAIEAGDAVVLDARALASQVDHPTGAGRRTVPHLFTSCRS